MNRIIADRFVPLAEEAMKEAKIIHNNTVNKEMTGYVSGFCVCALESLPMAVLSYQKDEKKKVADAVNRMLQKACDLAKEDKTAFPGITELKISTNGLFDTVKNNQKSKKLLQEYCLTCAVAIKLLLQLYKE